MKTNQDKGKLSIEMDCNNQIVVFQPKDGAVWMNRNYLCELFGVYQKTINTHLDAIFSTKTYHVEKVCHYSSLCEGK